METAREKKTTARALPLPSQSARWGALSKRLFDVIVAALGLLILSPVFSLLSYLIQRESPGPAFYRGPRLGKGGKPFGILKFRTMYERPSSYAGPRLTVQGDGRITPLGQWLRDTKLNELPQLWNVLVGEMSLVGPRPEDPEIARSWPLKAKQEILSVQPGITSPASVVYRDEESLLPSGTEGMDEYYKVIMPDKLRLDQLYVRNHHFLSDVDVIFWTGLVLLPALRKKPLPIESIFGGPLYRFASRFISWFAIDIGVAFIAIGTAGVLWRLGGPLDLGVPQAVARAAGIALLFSLVNSWLGLGRVWWRSARPAQVFNLAFSSGVSTGLLVLLELVWPPSLRIPLGMVVIAGLLAFLGFVAVRYRERLITGFATLWVARRPRPEAGGEPGQRALIVGAGECAMLTNWLLQHSHLDGDFSVVGMVDDDISKAGMTVDGHTVFGLTRRIPELVERLKVDVILFAIETIQPEEQERILSLCRRTPARVVLVPDLLSMFREGMTSSLAAREGG